MTLDYFNAFTVTVTPQSVLWKCSSISKGQLGFHNLCAVILNDQVEDKNYICSLSGPAEETNNLGLDCF